MTRAEQVRHLLERYGQEIAVRPRYRAECRVRGLIYPISYRKLPSSNELGISFDESDDEGYVYLGSAACRLDKELEQVRLEQDGTVYLVTKSRAVYLQDETIYVCAVLQKAAQQ